MELSRAISLVAVVLIIVLAVGYAADDGSTANASEQAAASAAK
jgi:hypothetical protein